MPTYTRQASDTLVLMRLGTSNRAANDVHLTVGRGSGSQSDYIGRVEFKVPEPSNWPTAGTLKEAIMTVEESPTDMHPWFDGGSSRIEIRRQTERTKFAVQARADGHGDGGYSSEGDGTKYPGSSPAGAAVTVSVNGHQSFDVTSMIRQMLPSRFGGANELYGYFQIRSVDEDSSSRSVILSRQITLSITIDTRVVPGEVEILEVIGAQEDTPSGATLVASDDGRTLAVRFGFAAGAGETCSKATIELYGPGATDAVLGTRIAFAVNAPPISGGGSNIYIARLTGIPQGTEGKWRIKATSSTGREGPWTSVEDDSAYVQMATIPGAPVDVTVEPTTDEPEISASLPSSHSGTISHMEALVTLLPQGRTQPVIGSDIGGGVRRATVVYDGEALAAGQRTSTVVRLTDQDGIVGVYGAPVLQTHESPPAATGPAITAPAPGRQLTPRPTFTITASSFDGWRLRLLHETDDTIVVYDSGATVVVDQTSVNVQIPAGTLAYGQRFRAVASVVPDGGGTTYGEESAPLSYSIAALPTSRLSVPGAVGGAVAVEDVGWLLTIVDPDGGTITQFDLELRDAAVPQGSGALHRRWYHAPTGSVEHVPGGEVLFETSVDARVRARNDATVLAATTLAGSASAGATTISLTSATGFAIGQDVVVMSADGEQWEVRRITNLVSTTATLDESLAYVHASGQEVHAMAFGPWSSWLTITAMEPPDVDLLIPVPGATVTRPWQTLDWVTSGYGGRTQASATISLYADDLLVGTVAVDGSATLSSVPAFLLDDATAYEWDVTVIDSKGMENTSTRRSFTTAFTVPTSPPVLSAVVAEGNVVLAWDASDDPDIHHYEVSWQADDGTWVRIDGGPEEYGDGLPAFTGATLTHIGARLGVNAYSIRPHNGWSGSEPVNATIDLGWSDPGRGTWELVRADGDVIPVRVSDASSTTEAMMDVSQPLAAEARALSWGIGARSIPMRVVVIPTEDGSLAMTLRRLMANPATGRAASPVWVRAPAGYRLDPVWCVLRSFTAIPAVAGIMDVSMDWLEVGPAVHAILPEPLPVTTEAEPDIYSDPAELDFGAVSISGPFHILAPNLMYPGSALATPNIDTLFTDDALVDYVFERIDAFLLVSPVAGRAVNPADPTYDADWLAMMGRLRDALDRSAGRVGRQTDRVQLVVDVGGPIGYDPGYGPSLGLGPDSGPTGRSTPQEQGEISADYDWLNSVEPLVDMGFDVWAMELQSTIGRLIADNGSTSAPHPYRRGLGDAHLIDFTTLPGTAWSDVTIDIDMAGLNTPLSVSTVGHAVTVHSATDGAGVGTSLASAVVTAVNAAATVLTAELLGTDGLVEDSAGPQPVYYGDDGVNYTATEVGEAILAYITRMRTYLPDVLFLMNDSSPLLWPWEDIPGYGSVPIEDQPVPNPGLWDDMYAVITAGGESIWGYIFDWQAEYVLKQVSSINVDAEDDWSRRTVLGHAYWESKGVRWMHTLNSYWADWDAIRAGGPLAYLNPGEAVDESGLDAMYRSQVTLLQDAVRAYPGGDAVTRTGHIVYSFTGHPTVLIDNDDGHVTGVLPPDSFAAVALSTVRDPS